MKTKEELIKTYCENEKKIKRLNNENSVIEEEIKQFFGHKVGEIVRWAIPEHQKIVGDCRHPRFINVPAEERICVLVSIEIMIDKCCGREKIFYNPEFHPIKKDGSVSKKCAYAGEYKVLWTGEIHKDFQN